MTVQWPGYTPFNETILSCDRCQALVARSQERSRQHDSWHTKMEERLTKLGQSAAAGEEARDLMRPLG